MVSTPDISVVVPVFDEEGAAPALAREIAAAFAGRSFEVIFVDDASRDGTRAALKALSGEIPQLRVLAHADLKQVWGGGIPTTGGRVSTMTRTCAFQ